MKKILFSLIAVLCCMNMSAQKIIVYQGGEQYATFDVDEVDSIVYKATTGGSGDAGGESGAVDANSWTVMFYSVGGGNLDTAQVQNMSQAMRSQVNSKINMTFQFKFSKELQSKVATNQQGTFFFDMAAVRSELGTDASTYDDNGTWMANITTEKIGDASYDMSKASNLTTFINKSIALHPAAHYMLILSDHGSGWNAIKDNVVNAAKGASITGILADDNNDTELSAASVEQAIKNSNINSKKVDAIYGDACLMATAENLFQYYSVANYFLGAVELTPGMGGEYTKLLDYIGASPADMWTVGKNYVNYLVSDQHWGKDGKDFADLGIYNLNELCSENSAVVTNIADFATKFKTDYANNTDKFNYAVTHTQIASSDQYGGYEYNNEFSSTALTANEEGKITNHDLRNYYLNNTAEFVSKYKSNPSAINALLSSATDDGSCALIMADFMNQIVAQMGESSDYKTYYDGYIAALKNCAYIRSAYNPTDEDFAFQHTSMSVNVYGMNTAALQDWNSSTETTWLNAAKNAVKVGNMSKMVGKSADDLIKAYNESNFDVQTGWCEGILTPLQVNPGIFFNCSLESMNLSK